ncbi:MAG: hypothetical protein IT163_14920 [Bryobacterales bacterium]|nr:hypothetical protein [Bryobacterales bacterium]
MRPTCAAVSLALLFCGAAPLMAAAPRYTASSIVNAASGVSSILAPNGLATIHGTDLSGLTQALSASDLRGDQLPYTLHGTGVGVVVSGLRAHVVYVSPSQVNFLVPALLQPGPATVVLTRLGVSGDAVKVLIAGCSPGLFLLKPGLAVATRADGSVLTEAAPAHPGEVVVLYATGLGQTAPPLGHGERARTAAWLARRAEFAVVLDGRTLTAEVLYAGVTPGFGGLYQVNLRLPERTGPNPEILLLCGDTASPAGVRLPVGTLPGPDASTQ